MKKPLFPKHPPVPQPHNAPIWQDMHAFFKELFETYPKAVERFYHPKELVDDLTARFGGKYNLDEVCRMLEIAYKTNEKEGQGRYIFHRLDFFKAPADQEAAAV
jgi:hypothetical protein